MFDPIIIKLINSIQINFYIYYTYQYNKYKHCTIFLVGHLCDCKKNHSLFILLQSNNIFYFNLNKYNVLLISANISSLILSNSV